MPGANDAGNDTLDRPTSDTVKVTNGLVTVIDTWTRGAAPGGTAYTGDGVNTNETPDAALAPALLAGAKVDDVTVPLSTAELASVVIGTLPVAVDSNPNR